MPGKRVICEPPPPPVIWRTAYGPIDATRWFDVWSTGSRFPRSSRAPSAGSRSRARRLHGRGPGRFWEEPGPGARARSQEPGPGARTILAVVQSVDPRIGAPPRSDMCLFYRCLEGRHIDLTQRAFRDDYHGWCLGPSPDCSRGNALHSRSPLHVECPRYWQRRLRNGRRPASPQVASTLRRRFRNARVGVRVHIVVTISTSP